MAVTTWSPGQVLAAQDLNDTFASKLDLAGGKILQIVRATDSTNRSTTSTSAVDANLSVTITPQFSNSSILIIALVSTDASSNSSTNIFGRIVITDSSDNPLSGAGDLTTGTIGYSLAGTDRILDSATQIGFSTPATTSAVTYKLRFFSGDANTTFLLRNASNTAQLYAVEVSA